jgi:hypothetical protein
MAMTQPPRPSRDAARLLWTLFAVFGAQMLLLLGSSLFHFGGHPSWIFAQPTDIFFFQDAAQAWLKSGNPYLRDGFVTPPPSLLFSLPLVPFSRPLADHLFLFANVLLLGWSLYRYATVLGLRRGDRAFVLCAAAIFFSTMESVREGNLDVLMLALLILAFTMRANGGAIALGASIGAKAYSALFLPVLLRLRQWRMVAVTVATLCVLMLPFHRLWLPAYHALQFRGGRYWGLSIAPATLVLPFLGGDARREEIATWLLVELLATSFLIALLRDRSRRVTPQTLARYAPWMLSAPSLVFSYVAVQALPVLMLLLATARRRALRRAEWCIFLGFLLLGVHVERIVCALPMAETTFRLIRDHAAMVQSLGVVLMIVGTALNPCSEDD